MATGHYDANGFWHYGEDDLADEGAGFSDVLNKGAVAVAAAVPPLVRERVTQELHDDPAITAYANNKFAELVANRHLADLTPDIAARMYSDFVTLSDTLTLIGAQFAPSLGFGVGVGDERSPIWVDPENGDVHIAGIIFRAGGEGLHIGDADERELWSLDGATGATPTRRVVVLWVNGQSNPDGRAMPYGPEVTPQDDRIVAYNHADATLIKAPIPLPSRAPNARAGYSYVTALAEEVLRQEPAGTILAIVNCAVGASGLVSQPTAGRWLWGAAGSLAPGSITAMNNALTLIAAQYPGAEIDVRGIWGQGEADSDGPAYAAALATLLPNLAAGINRPSMTWTITGIVPEYIIANPSRAAIRQALLDAPRTMQRTGYADGIPNGGGAYDVTDIVHYNLPGAKRLGKAAYEAYRRAINNTAASVPLPPMDVEARRADGVVRVTWTIPPCRVTSYLVQYSADGNAWTTVARPLGDPYAPAGLVLEPVATFATSGPVLVRIATVNDAKTSAFSTPTRSIGA